MDSASGALTKRRTIAEILSDDSDCTGDILVARLSTEGGSGNADRDALSDMEIGSLKRLAVLEGGLIYGQVKHMDAAALKKVIRRARGAKPARSHVSADEALGASTKIVVRSAHKANNGVSHVSAADALGASSKNITCTAREARTTRNHVSAASSDESADASAGSEPAPPQKVVTVGKRRSKSMSPPSHPRQHEKNTASEQRVRRRRREREHGYARKEAVKKHVGFHKGQTFLDADVGVVVKGDWEDQSMVNALEYQVFGTALRAHISEDDADRETASSTKNQTKHAENKQLKPDGKTHLQNELKTTSKREETLPPKCPNCDFAITFHPTHCCATCVKTPGTHGKKCKQVTPEEAAKGGCRQQ